MNIIEIYNKYYIPENLQMHMLRVTACANLIIENYNGPKVDKEKIIRVCLLHDMGNIAKIHEDEVDDINFKGIRRKYIEKYGEYDHPINLAIGKEVGLTNAELEILDGKRSRYNEKTLASDSYEIKICAYCDQRVAPDGVVSIKERLEDAKRRYKDVVFSVWSDEEKANRLIECSLGIEKQIFDNCSIRPEEINDKSIAKYIEELKQFDIEYKG